MVTFQKRFSMVPMVAEYQFTLGQVTLKSISAHKPFYHCNVSRDVIEEMRWIHPRGQNPRPFLFKNNTFRQTDNKLIDWADVFLQAELIPCVKCVIELEARHER
eukprot:CCRYP_004256-RA/>CCRYP_004256-RA protein AED:0.27 eAED:0.28 QI:0/-1/0/1/-1/0/1/0/103